MGDEREEILWNLEILYSYDREIEDKANSARKTHRPTLDDYDEGRVFTNSQSGSFSEWNGQHYEADDDETLDEFEW